VHEKRLVLLFGKTSLANRRISQAAEQIARPRHAFVPNRRGETPLRAESARTDARSGPPPSRER
jgi:hypothetical protein